MAALPPYTEKDLDRITTTIAHGAIPGSVLPSHVYQAHLLYLKAENVLNVYDDLAIPEFVDN